MSYDFQSLLEALGDEESSTIPDSNRLSILLLRLTVSKHGQGFLKEKMPAFFLGREIHSMPTSTSFIGAHWIRKACPNITSELQ